MLRSCPFHSSNPFVCRFQGSHITGLAVSYRNVATGNLCRNSGQSALFADNVTSPGLRKSSAVFAGQPILVPPAILAVGASSGSACLSLAVTGRR
jgi:hypothetical protein